jgi:hypothetical protein
MSEPGQSPRQFSNEFKNYGDSPPFAFLFSHANAVL